jgi:diguanylate cyclase (GGDEF)-like protein
MIEPSSVSQQIPKIDRPEPASYAPYAQLVKMLVPSSGCMAIYDVGADLIWCSDGYERPELRELIGDLQAERADPALAIGQIRQTSSGALAYSSRLTADDGTALGFVAIQLGSAQSGAQSGSMAPSLLRPVLECLAARIGLERAAERAQPPEPKAGELSLLLALDDEETEGPAALQRLVAHCVENLDCASGAFLVPEKNVSIVAYRAATPPTEAARFLDRTQKHLLAWARLNNRPMVVNRIGSDGGVAPYKILSCPVRDAEQRVTGLMAVFRSGSAPNFETRDVQVLELVGRKAIGLLGSQHDPLTGLMNKPIFERRVQRMLESGSGRAGGVLLYLDIDRLQAVNDAFGFHAGDEVIQRLAMLIRGVLAGEDVACRVGGDRFAVFLPERDETQASGVATALLGAMADLGYLRGADAVPVSVSIGLATPGPARRDFNRLIAAAELACKRAQQQGGNALTTYTHGVQSSPLRESEAMAAAAVRQALQSSEFRLLAQPIVDLYKDAGKVLGYEVLVRMRSASGALLSPDKFVRAAERYGLMPALDKWVLAAAVKALQAHEHALRDLPLGIAVNVSAQSLATPDFAAFALATLEHAGLPPEAFCFELKESAAVHHLSDAERLIKTLTQAGCHISLDDFGSGLSSLAHLKRLKVSYLKIDGHLVRRVLDDVHAESLVHGLAKAAQTLGVLTVAEHVESAAHADKLQRLEVDLAQGYHYGHPIPLERAIGESIRGER